MVVVVGLLGIAGMSNASAGWLVLTGSSTVVPLALEIAKRFEQQNPGLRIDVQSGGSSRGVANARSGPVLHGAGWLRFFVFCGQ
ncbi:MAG: hypothetical protein ACOH2K_00090 [Burkholderiaceae bacterium]